MIECNALRGMINCTEYQCLNEGSSVNGCKSLRGKTCMANGIGCLNKNEEQRMNEITYDDYSTRCPNKKEILVILV